MAKGERGKVALLWRGDLNARQAASREGNRLTPIFEALANQGIDAEPCVYSDDFADEVCSQLSSVDGVLVWVDPLSDGKTREKLDPLLRDVASHGVWVSAHPDIILKMGTKEVLWRTRELGWGTDTYVYRSVGEFLAEFPKSLECSGPRVLKRNRGNGGQGVWKVEHVSTNRVRVLHALRGSVQEELLLEAFLKRCENYFGYGGLIVDQPFQIRLPEGMIRCYVGADKVVGFGHQLIKALIPPPPEGPNSPEAQPGPRIMHPASAFPELRDKMEREWTPQLMNLLEIDVGSMPIIWDADFLYGPKDSAGNDTYVLCEINVSAVLPIPDQAPEEIARLVKKRLQSE